MLMTSGRHARTNSVSPDGQLEVELNGGTLELPPKGIKDSDVNLGAVEGAICRVQLQATDVMLLRASRVFELCAKQDRQHPAERATPYDYCPKGSESCPSHTDAKVPVHHQLESKHWAAASTPRSQQAGHPHRTRTHAKQSTLHGLLTFLKP